MNKKNHSMIAIRGIVLSLLILFSLSSCSSRDSGNSDEINTVRAFFQAMSDGNYQKVVELMNIPEMPKGETIGIGDQEISLFQKRFPWSGKKLIKVAKLPTSRENDCRYELQIESNGVVEKDNLYLIKKNNKWHVALIEQLRSEGN